MAARGLRNAPLMPLAGFAIIFLAAIVAFSISHSMATANRGVDHSIAVRLGLVDLGRHIAEQNAGFRGYLLVATPMEKNEALRGTRAALRDYARLRAIMTDEPTQRADLDALGPELAERNRYIQARMLERANGGTGLGDETSRPHMRELVTRIDAQLRRMSEEEQRLLEVRQARSQRLIEWLSIALAGAVMFVVLVAYLTVRDARQRFMALRNATREARAAAIEAARESAGRVEAEAQLHQIQKMESIGHLTGGIAHDFNNMLAVIVGSLDLARRRIGDPERISRHISDALEAAGRATTLVSRLLAFSRRQALSPIALATNDFLVDIVELLRRTLGETITVVTKLTPATWPLFADPVQLQSALLNLAVNARDAMEHGGRLTLTTYNVTLHPNDTKLGDLDPGDYVELVVTDDGSGMPPDVIAQAFDPFFTTKAVGRGTGLGLSQVFGFVRQSGGLVTIDSEVGTGTTVRLLLPRHLGELGEGPAATDAETALSGKGERVLLVEDDERVRRFSADALRELGYVPLTAANGAEALQRLLDDRDVQVLFTDVVMPGMSGQELAAAVRSMRPSIRILYTTGYARDGNALGLAQLDAPVLHKPFDVSELGIKLREILSA